MSTRLKVIWFFFSITQLIIPSLEANELTLYTRSERTIYVGESKMRVAFISRMKAPESLFHPQERAFWTGYQDQIVGEIDWAEKEKFRIYNRRKFLTYRHDRKLINSLKAFEPLRDHDEILLLYEDIWTTKSILVGMLAISRGDELLMERRLGLSIEKPGVMRIARNSKHVRDNLHWRTTIRELSLQHYVGGAIQINSLAVADNRGISLYPLLYFLAYWHGLYSVGEVVPPEGLTRNGKHIEGPGVIHPAYVLGEGYGSRARLYALWGLQRLLVQDKYLELTDPHSSRHSFSIMGIPMIRWMEEMSAILSQRKHYRELIGRNGRNISLEALKETPPDKGSLRLSLPPIQTALDVQFGKILLPLACDKLLSGTKNPLPSRLAKYREWQPKIELGPTWELAF